MSTTGGPGQGLSLALSVDTTLARIRNLQLPEITTQEVDFTGLEQLEWFQFLAASLKDGGSFSCEMFFDSEIAIPTVKALQTATITFALQTSTNTNPATLVGSGFITQLGLPQAAIGEPMIQNLTFRFDNIGTPIAFTPEAA